MQWTSFTVASWRHFGPTNKKKSWRIMSCSLICRDAFLFKCLCACVVCVFSIRLYVCIQLVNNLIIPRKKCNKQTISSRKIHRHPGKYIYRQHLLANKYTYIRLAICPTDINVKMNQRYAFKYPRLRSIRQIEL